jgi:hypothetical protein
MVQTSIQSRNDDFTNQNIYITNDEKIKEGDWFITKTNDILKVQKPEKGYEPIGKKIILTTNPELIKDGVQKIDDEFLEWFVKNPSCEDVEVETKITKDGVWTDLKGYVELPTIHSIKYKIIIPKEKPKQDLEKEMFELEQELDIPSHLRWHNSKPEQETIEEVAERILFDNTGMLVKNHPTIKKSMLDLAKWQQQQNKNLYSEEDMKYAFDSGRVRLTFDKERPFVFKNYEEFIEQFKKK